MVEDVGILQNTIHLRDIKQGTENATKYGNGFAEGFLSDIPADLFEYVFENAVLERLLTGILECLTCSGIGKSANLRD